MSLLQKFLSTFLVFTGFRFQEVQHWLVVSNEYSRELQDEVSVKMW